MQIQHITENKVLVSKQSIFSGKVNQMVLPLRQSQIEYWLQSCLLIQDVLPDLDADQRREFLLSGSTPEEWDEMFGEDECRLTNVTGLPYVQINTGRLSFLDRCSFDNPLDIR